MFDAFSCGFIHFGCNNSKCDFSCLTSPYYLLIFLSMLSLFRLVNVSVIKFEILAEYSSNNAINENVNSLLLLLLNRFHLLEF